MTTFNIVDIVVEVFNSLFSYIGLDHKFMCEVPESSLNSTESVNTLVGISGDIEGNIMFGFTEKTANEIVSKLTGVNQNSEVDIYSKAALADFFSEFCKRTINTLRKESLYNMSGGAKDYVVLSSNPTYIAGENMSGVISKSSAKKLFFKVNGEKFGIAYSLETK